MTRFQNKASYIILISCMVICFFMYHHKHCTCVSVSDTPVNVFRSKTTLEEFMSQYSTAYPNTTYVYGNDGCNAFFRDGHGRLMHITFSWQDDVLVATSISVLDESFYENSAWPFREIKDVKLRTSEL